MNRAVIAFGSNINPVQNIQKAKEKIARKHRIISESEFVMTKPIGFLGQPDFLNGSALIETSADFDGLKAELKNIETNLGRIHTAEKNSPRPIDLDIVVWNDKLVDEDFYQREFLKKSVLEVLPELKY